VRSSAVFYELTNRGQKVLRSCEGIVYSSGVFRLHKCQVLFPIVREGVYPAGDYSAIVSYCNFANHSLQTETKQNTKPTIERVHIRRLIEVHC
jgi:hypothetical protein